jgi:hypothetical protein
MTSAPTEQKAETLIDIIVRHWRGQGRLSWAYWNFHFAGGLILLFVLAVAFLFILPFAYREGDGIRHSPVFAVYLVVFGMAYLGHAIASIVMIWRCGPNVEWGGWTVLSRVQLFAWIYNWLQFVAIATGTVLVGL